MNVIMKMFNLHVSNKDPTMSTYKDVHSGTGSILVLSTNEGKRPGDALEFPQGSGVWSL